MPLLLVATFLAAILSFVVAGAGVWIVASVLAGAAVAPLVVALGILLLAFTLLGRPLAVLLFGRAGNDPPHDDHAFSVDGVLGTDATPIHVERQGELRGAPVVLVHGWGMNSGIWYYQRRSLSRAFRVVTYDLRGLGRSGRPRTRDYSLETQARDLEAVLQGVDRPAVLVGHGIGGMIALTLAAIAPETVRRRVAAFVLIDTTHTDPTRTVPGAWFFHAVKTALLRPLCRLMIWLAPLVWFGNQLSFANGTAHVVSALVGCGGSQTRSQLDFATSLTVSVWPATLARGSLAMLRYERSAVLARIDKPTLIVCGENDRLTTLRASEAMRDAIPDARLVILRRAGHLSFMERHEMLDRELADFIASVSAPARLRRGA